MEDTNSMIGGSSADGEGNSAGGNGSGGSTSSTTPPSGKGSGRFEPGTAPHTKSGRNSSTKKVKRDLVAKRVRAYPHVFKEDAGKLRCYVCKEFVAVESTAVNRHLKSAKHTTSVAKRDQKAATDVVLLETISDHFKETNAKGMTLPEQQNLYRVKTLQSLMRAGAPIAYADSLRDQLEGAQGERLTSATNLSQLIPVVLKQEMATIKAEIKGQQVAIVFDSTTFHTDEVLAIVARYVILKCMRPALEDEVHWLILYVTYMHCASAIRSI